MKKPIKWLIILAFLTVIAAGAWWWLKPKNEITYLTEDVKRTDIEQTVSATGEISAAQLVDVGAQSTGQINKLYVKVGQQVKKGDLIADIDSTTQKNTLSTHKAQLETYQAKLVSAQIALKSAENKYKREQALWAENATSKEELESVQDALAAAKANIAEIKSAIRQTQISINTAEADLGHTRIKAPMSGTVVSIVVEEGQTVNSNQSAPTIVQIADLTKMLNKMQVAEGDVDKVKAGSSLTFTTLAQPDRVRKGVLDSVDPGLTTMSKGSYTKSTDTTDSAIYYYARAYVPNEDHSLYIGMTTENSIVVNSVKQVLAVPTLAVKYNHGKAVVRVLGEQNQAQEREVVVGLSDGMSTEIKSGLKEGEKVIVSEVSADEKNTSRGMGRPPM
ncbi:ABC transporter substrate-binding protein [Neisseria arctica]|uniref:ABC transporter substrate-binding protein n=1 Tax=Neisseria arctica TaxID=1470200 RepID=A0A0J0YU40_9NEIS|nr:efflux RND transporter periplasmic adaptor subunit [Neisseria arctica]KLT73615.1 ABC transporter substrate-binding protein [Neisseria arctica]UOO85737.1 efflux RND transporter periplasmic adaptor subunit [Neisseria arctica]